MSERLGRRSGPQAPSAFIKLRCQRALCGSNHLDRRIILPAQTLSKPTAEVHENDSLFIYDSFGVSSHLRNNFFHLSHMKMIPLL